MSLPDPLCMSPDEIAAWREQARYVIALTGKTYRTLDPCSDCTLAFAAAMRAQDRCNGIPGMARKVTRRVVPTAEQRRCRQMYFRQRCVEMGIDPAHAERIG